ncbi:Cytochrome o ubiquinol oxidase protein CyoD [Serratia entomophila]|jgi:cytochrome o ubiquinol oxidase operon protein cyoD|uniref:Cytochrome bo(3) ubiquinol oxidase subunit 4 n=2 Tax=Serratia TaxID=613 RepID=A0A240BGH5_SERFI|nr:MULTISPECIES: cytochrome o ubiquinol oxidase subunit IV [Serratia]MEE4483096.1 cytochrome o ubiquinol oxidase subunit IV [Serratia ficaria]REF46071.1 cytochrome bo3 quinol oxidase subunit 4 [Serratia ficaria]UIW19351.1 cytochrome o ubiquinol oxidase subunit IV [Serratia entomophila]USV01939.1 cytochrome o ubiquinol oxidase subunit IV [Serratia entomophila]CAI0709846.1 Cytochrome o ubiquinol oxidase protein CyoD [Serratia entomophila]
MSHSSHETSHGGASHGSVKSYLIGFILSIILTVIPFAMVMNGTASHSTILAVVVGMAVIQVVVHLIYFLHMNTSSEERWNLVALLFTAMIIGIVVVGSLWIMYNLNINMMVS